MGHHALVVSKLGIQVQIFLGELTKQKTVIQAMNLNRPEGEGLRSRVT